MAVEKCPKCQTEHDLSLPTCPKSAASRVLPPTKAPSANPEAPTSVAPPPAAKPTVLMTAPAEEKKEVVVTPAPTISEAPTTAKETSDVPIEGLFASLKAAQEKAAESTPPPAPKPSTELKTSTEAVVMPPKQGAEKVLAPALSLLEKGKTLIKGREKIAAGIGGGVVLLLLVWLLWPSTKPTAPSVPVVDSKLFSSNNVAGDPPAEPTSEESPTDTTELVTLKIESNPEGALALVWLNENPINAGPTPCEVQVPKDSEVEVTFAAYGYEPKQKIARANDGSVKANLTAAGAKGNPPKKSSGTKSGGTKKTSGGHSFGPGGGR